MNFLEITKDYLARMEKEQAELGVRVVDGHPVKRIVWETEKAIVFEDTEGRYWRYLHAFGQSWPVIIVTRDQDSN